MPRKLPGSSKPPPASQTPTGNPLSDSELQAILAASAQVTAAVGAIADTTNQQLDAVAANCMWPPSAQVTVPLIPGLWSQTVHTGCLVTYSEVRALFAGGLILTGLSLVLWGAAEIAFLAGAGVILNIVNSGGGSAKAGAAGAAVAKPAVAAESAAAPELALAA